MTHGCVLEEILDEEDIARDPLNWFDEEVIECEPTLGVLSSLLGKQVEAM